jgi:hypothetical protein
VSREGLVNLFNRWRFFELKVEAAVEQRVSRRGIRYASGFMTSGMAREMSSSFIIGGGRMKGSILRWLGEVDIIVELLGLAARWDRCESSAELV